MTEAELMETPARKIPVAALPQAPNALMAHLLPGKTRAGGRGQRRAAASTGHPDTTPG
jgi:hypothetical protein